MKAMHLFTHDFRPGHVYNIPSCPDNVMLDLGYKCNLRCRFCYNHREQFATPEPPLDVVLKIISALTDWGVREVLYLGGEPLIFDHFESVLQHGRACGLKQRMVTNGVVLDERKAEILTANAVETGVSLHGCNATIHDALTQVRGSFDRTMRGIRRLNNGGATWFVQYTPTRGHAELLPFTQWLQEQFPDRPLFLDINRLLPRGVGAGEQYAFFPTEQEWWQALSDIPRAAQLGTPARVESVPHCWVRSKATQDGLPEEDVQTILSAIRPCYMAINQIALDPEGRFKLCPGATAFSESVLEMPPADMWNSHPVLQERRLLSFLPKRCVDFEGEAACPGFYACGGGCKMAASGEEPRPGAPDPLVKGL